MYMVNLGGILDIPIIKPTVSEHKKDQDITKLAVRSAACGLKLHSLP